MLYLKHLTEASKNLYNTTNFYIRQIYTALKTDYPLHPLQQEVMDQLHTYLPIINETQRKAYQNRLKKQQEKAIEERKDVQLRLFEMPTQEKPFVSYTFLDALFKAMNQPDYRALPAHTAQGMMKNVFQNWNSFFKSHADYRENPQKYTAPPRIPNYKKGTEKDAVLSNQEATIHSRRFLKLPKTKTRLNIGKLGLTDASLQQVRILPRYRQYVIELVFKEDGAEETKPNNGRYLSIDLGIDNVLAITSNTGMRPVLIKGTKLKSTNQLYNKMVARYRGILRHGQEPKEGQQTSKRLEKLHVKRFLRIKDFFHKASFHAVKIAVEEEANMIVIGQNKGWKQKSKMGKRTNQSFCSIPHRLLIKMIHTKLKKQGSRSSSPRKRIPPNQVFWMTIPSTAISQEKNQCFPGSGLSVASTEQAAERRSMPTSTAA